MFKFDSNDMQRMVVAGLGALVLSITMIGTTVAPAHAIEVAPLAQLSAQVRA